MGALSDEQTEEPIPKAGQRRYYRLLSVAVLLVCLAVTGALWWLTRQQNETSLRDYFEFRVRAAVTETEQRLQAQVQVLLGVRGLFAASEKVTRAEFHDYYVSLHLDENYPGMQGLGFSQLVPRGQLKRHIALVGQDSGHADYKVWPEGERETYTSIIYLEPFYGRNLRAFGYDMHSEPVRRAAMDRATDSGAASMSGKVLLVQEASQDVQPGFLIYLPVYRNGAPQTTEQERRASLVGWVYSPFRMSDLARGMYGERSADLDIEIYDGPTLSRETLMYDSTQNHGPKPSALKAVRQVSVGGHTWTLAINSMPSMEARFENDKAQVVAYGGVALSLSLAALVELLVGWRRRAEAYARRMTKRLRKESETNKAFLRNASDGIHILDAHANIVEASDSFCEMLGYGRDEVIGMNLRQWDAGGAEPELTNKFSDQFARKGRSQFETRHRRKDGSIIDVEVSGVPLKLEGRQLLFNSSRDITERKRLEEQVRHLAFYDPLTNLPNRRLLRERMSQVFSSNRRKGYYGAVLYLDLDNFKPLNDRYGHEAGDLLLVEVGRRLRGCVRGMDVVARLGGDEFVVLLSELSLDEAESRGEAGVVAEKVRGALAEPYQLEIERGERAGQVVEHRCTASIGVLVFSSQDSTPEDVLYRADAAMYQAKASGRNVVQFASGEPAV